MATRKELENKGMPELWKIASKFGISKRGTKDKLIDRIMKYISTGVKGDELDGELSGSKKCKKTKSKSTKKKTNRKGDELAGELSGTKSKSTKKKTTKKTNLKGDELSGDSVTLSGEELLGYNISKKKKAKNLNKLYGKPAYLKRVKGVLCLFTKNRELAEKLSIGNVDDYKVIRKKKTSDGFLIFPATYKKSTMYRIPVSKIKQDEFRKILAFTRGN